MSCISVLCLLYTRLNIAGFNNPAVFFAYEIMRVLHHSPVIVLMAE